MTDEEFLDMIRNKIEGPAFTTIEVADLVEMSDDGVRGRLEKLHQRGEIMKKKPSHRTVIWYYDSGYQLSDLSA